MTRVLYTSEFPSTAEAIGQALREALQVLVLHNWCTEDKSFFMRLCLEEALVNAVRHGNKNTPTLKVRVDICEQGDEHCHIYVQDEGEGFDPHAVSMPDCSQMGGRGICLIKHFMKDVQFNIVDKCLEMVFSRDTFCCCETTTPGT